MKRVLVAFLVTRALAVGATHLGARFMTPEKHADWDWVQGRSDLHLLPPPPAFLAPLQRWDANFYVAMAVAGYPAPRASPPVYHLNFLPLYPLMVRATAVVVRNYFWAAFLVSNLCCLLAALLMLRLGGADAAVLFLASPGAHFFSYPYSEALFALLLAAGFLALQSQRFAVAAAAGAAACATRSPGVVVAVALAVQRKFAWAAAALAGLAAYMAWCWRTYGDALAFVHLQAPHGRVLSVLGPFKALFAFNVDPDYYLVTLAALAVAVWMIRRSPLWMTVSAWFLLLLPMATGTLAAMVRYQAINLPLFCAAPAKNRWVLAACAALMCVEAFLFGKGIGHY